MTEYERLLTEVLAKINAFRSTTAREYIPKMYEALRKDDPLLTPQDIRNTIERDCLNKIWTRRTILDALPDEAKNAKRQEAARSRSKKNFAAMTAAKLSTRGEKEILVDVTGKSIENENDLKPAPTFATSKVPMAKEKDNRINVVFFLQANEILDHLFDRHLLCSPKEPRVWINVSIDRETNKVISASISCHLLNQ
jgi:hypothetical protein